MLIYIKSKDNHILSNLITPDSLAYSAVHLMCSRKRASYNIRGSIIAFCGAYIQSTSTDTTRVYQSITQCTSVYQSLPDCARVYQSILRCTKVYQSILRCTKLYQSVLRHTKVYQSVLRCTKVYQSVLECTKVYQGASGTSLCDIFL